MRKILFLIFLGVVFSSAACTKKEETSKMTVAFPDWKAVTQKYSPAKSGKGDVSAQAAGDTTVVSRVMINITGSDIATQVLIWDLYGAGYQEGGPIPTPPASFSFEVKNGTDRLFQALAIVKTVVPNGGDDSDGPMTFLYGDVTKTTSQSVESLQIPLTVQAISGGIDAHISGRYLNADGTSPSGKLNMYYAPTGRPEMIVDTGTIFTGFFDISLPAVAPFSYRTASGTKLFEKVTMSSFTSQLGPQLMKVEVPAGYHQRSAGRVASNAKTKVIGFVGPGADATKKICYKNVPEPLSDLYTTGTAGDSSVVNWSPASGSSADARVVGGGVGTSDGACTGVTIFGGDHLISKTQVMAYGDSPSGIRGPFREVAIGSNTYVAGSLAAGVLTLNWKYLTPTISDSIAGVGIFTKTFAATENVNNRWQDTAPCSQLTTLGFTEITRVASGTKASPVETYALNGVSATDYAAGKHVTLLCPYSPSGTYYDFALVHYNQGNSNQVPASKITVTRAGTNNISSAGTPSNVAIGICTPLTIRTVDAGGNLAPPPNGTTLQLTLTGSAPSYFFYDSNCTTGYKNNTLSMYNSEQTIYVNLDSAAQIAIIDAASVLTQATFYSSAVSATSATKVFAMRPQNVYAHQCFPVTQVRAVPEGADYLPQGGSSMAYLFTSLPMGNYPGLTFYNDGNCTTTVSTPSINGSTTSTVQVWAKYTGALAQIDTVLDGTSSSLIPIASTTNVSQPGPVTQIQAQLPMNIREEDCVPMIYRAVDAGFHASPITTGSLNITPNFGAAQTAYGGLYNDMACTSAVGGTVPMSNGTSQSAMLYVRYALTTPLSTAALAVTLSGSSSDGKPIPPVNLTLAPAGVARILAYVPGINHDPFSVLSGFQTGQRFTAMTGSFMLTLEARSALGNLVTGMSGANLGASGVNLKANFDAVTCTTGLNWVNGIANFSACYMGPASYQTPYQLYFSTGGGGTSPYPMYATPTQFVMTPPGETQPLKFYSRGFSYSTGACQPLMIQRRYGATVATAVSAVNSVTLTPGAGVTGFYSDPICSSAVANGDITQTTAMRIVYAKLGVSVPGPTANGTTLTDPSTGTTPTLVPIVTSTAVKYMITVAPQTMMLSCDAMMVTLTDTNGAAVINGVSQTVTLTSGGLAAGFYNSPDCSGAAIGSTTLPAGQSTLALYYRSNAAVGSGTITATDGASRTGTSGPINATFSP